MIVVDLDLLVAEGHHPLAAVLGIIPHGKTNVAIATEIMIVIAEGIETALEVLNIGRLSNYQRNSETDIFTYIVTVTAIQKMSAMIVTERKMEQTVMRGKVVWYLALIF